MPNKNKVFGLIIHQKLAEALKINTYRKEHLINHSSNFEVPDTIVIDSEPYCLYCINDNEIIRGNIFLENKIQSNENDVVCIACNIVGP